MKFTGEFVIPRIDIDSYEKQLHEHMLNVVAQAVVEWLQSFLETIPVWSGASRATFKPLASEINLPILISPVTNSRESTGEGLSTGKIFSEHGQYYFVYDTELPWLIYNEYNNANVDPDPTLWGTLISPGPYQFQIKGYEAFKHFADTVELPMPVIQTIVLRV